MDKINDKTLNKVFQEIILEFSQMSPMNLSQLEEKVMSAIRKIGQYLMEWKLNDWNEELKIDKCPKCGEELSNKKRYRQIVTYVSDVDYQRYGFYCSNCDRWYYPLDEEIGLRPYQRYSEKVEEISALCGASWDYEEAEYIMSKIMGRYVMSHKTIQGFTNEFGAEAGKDTEGSKIKDLEGDNKAQEEYFESMEVIDNPPEHIYIDMDGVMINSRENEKRMEGKVAVIWSDKEQARDDTSAIVDKKYVGSFSDSERFNWDIASEVYKRSGGEMDREGIIVRGDGAQFIKSFREEHLPKSRYILDYYHLNRKVKEELRELYEDNKELDEKKEKLIGMLERGEVEGAISVIEEERKRFRKEEKKRALDRLRGYIQHNREGIWYRDANSKGIDIGTGSVEKAGDILICRRLKLRGMIWSRGGADAVLNIRIKVSNGEWDQFWERYRSSKAA